MKCIYETTGSFQLVGATRAEFYRANRPTVHESTHFNQQFVGSGRLKVLGQVNDEATDAEFAKTWEEAKGDKDLAVASFIAEFPVEGTQLPAAKPKPAKKAEE